MARASPGPVLVAGPQLLVERAAWPEIQRTLAAEGFPQAVLAQPGGAPRALSLGGAHG